jgi:PadR family transcriptional regulator PadR
MAVRLLTPFVFGSNSNPPLLVAPASSHRVSIHPLTEGHKHCMIDLSVIDMSKQQSEIPHGTLDLLILKTLQTLGPMHGYAIARRIEQVSGDALQLSQGSIYPALIRLQQEGWISTEWGTSETNRKVKFYSLTKAGRKQLLVEVANWEKATALVARFLEASI